LAGYVALLKEAKHFREAWDVLRGAVASDPGNAALKADLIRVVSEVDGIDAAVLKSREFSKDDPKNSLYYRVLAELYEKAGRTPDAVALLEKARDAYPADDDLTIALAKLYMRAALSGKAESALNERLKSDPGNIAVRSALAPFYLTIGRPDEAKKIYQELLPSGRAMLPR
jgi:predicted Zn-dependent protease